MILLTFVFDWLRRCAVVVRQKSMPKTEAKMIEETGKEKPAMEPIERVRVGRIQTRKSLDEPHEGKRMSKSPAAFKPIKELKVKDLLSPEHTPEEAKQVNKVKALGKSNKTSLIIYMSQISKVKVKKKYKKKA